MTNSDAQALGYLAAAQEKLYDKGCYLEASDLAWARGYFMELVRASEERKVEA